MSAEGDIKAAILSVLTGLVPTTLAGATESDFRKDVLDADTPAFPWAYLMPPGVESERADNRTNLRTYTFGIVVLVKAEDVTDPEQVEDLQNAIHDAFDNAPTLSGAANGEVEPAVSPAEPVQTAGGKNLIVFTVTLRASRTYTLTA